MPFLHTIYQITGESVNGQCFPTTWNWVPLLHPKLQSNGKLEIFHKYLKPILKELCEKDLDNWDKYFNQVLASYCVMPYLTTAETPFFLVYGRGPNLPYHQMLESVQQFLGDPDAGHLDLKSHHLALAIAKKTLDENQFKYAQKMKNCTHPITKLVTVFFKIRNLANGTWSEVVTGLCT